MSEEKNTSSSKQDIANNIAGFTHLYFKSEKIYVDSEQELFSKISNINLLDIEYLKLYGFLKSAVDQLKSLDTSLLNIQFIKFSSNLESNIKRYKKFLKTNSLAKSIFVGEFLTKHSKYFMKLDAYIESTKRQLELNRSALNIFEGKMKKMAEDNLSKEDPKYKMLNKKFADALYNVEQGQNSLGDADKKKEVYVELAEKLFIPIFEKSFENQKKSLLDLINKKIYLFNKILWSIAKKSANVMSFFDSIVKDEPSLTTYIKYYLGTQSKSISDEDRKFYEMCMEKIGSENNTANSKEGSTK